MSEAISTSSAATRNPMSSISLKGSATTGGRMRAQCHAVVTRPLTETEITPQLGHSDAVSSAVTRCATPAADCLRLDEADPKADQVEQTRGVRYRIL
jgi:hypothetical protein